MKKFEFLGWQILLLKPTGKLDFKFVDFNPDADDSSLYGNKNMT